MIKMYIDNEEVVSNKEFTINEEMLSTSSTILNNCYPATWEQNHDYTSNFYYPKDYSKCKIYEYENDIINNYQIEGSLIQNGVPSPTNEIPIITKTEQINEVINNKLYTFSLGNIELCKLGSKEDKIYYNNGAWYLHKEITKIVINGTENWAYHNRNSLRTQTALFSIQYLIDDMEHLTYDYNTKSNYFEATNVYQNDIEGYFVYYSSRSYIYMAINRSIANNKTDFQNWLSNHNTTIYYVLQTPTDTEITDTTLLNQLNSVGIFLLFCGIVKNSGEISLNPRDPKYCSLQILDFKTLLSEGDMLDFVISNKTVEEAITMVVNAVSQYGFVLGNVNILGGNDIIGAYSTQNKTAYDVFQYLADITQSRWSTRLIDENTVAIDFYDPLLMPRANDIEYTQEYFQNNNIDSITFNYGTRDYRNKQVILSDEVYGSIDYIDTIITDGYSTSFITSSNIGEIKQILVNNVEKSFATNEDKQLGIEANFYYTPNKNTFESNTNEDTYTAGNTIVITYLPIIKGRQVVSNSNEIQRINTQINRNGVIARYETRNDILNINELEKIGQTYLKYKGSAEIILTINTTSNDMFDIGQIAYFNAPIDELKQDYMVKNKSSQIIATGNNSNIWYTYQLTSSFNSENAINYFDNQRNKTVGNIEEGAFITRNYDVENSATIIFDNLNIEEITITGDNVLNSILDSPFIE